MIREFEFFHGTVFARLLHGIDEPVSIKRFPASDNAGYVINDKIGIYIKYSGKRLAPWRFSFLRRHQDEIQLIKDQVGQVFLLLVCNDDGIVALSFDELKMILDDVHEEIEWISAKRTKRKMYSVAGSNGKLNFKIGKDDFPSKLFIPRINLS